MWFVAPRLAPPAPHLYRTLVFIYPRLYLPSSLFINYFPPGWYRTIDKREKKAVAVIEDTAVALEDLMDVIRFKEAAVKRGNHHSCIERELEELKAESMIITIPNYGKIPEGKQGAGHKAWLFIDEIIVE